MPQLENALLAGHDVIFLGERGQAKTRMIRSLTGLLDEWMPIVGGSEINDDPYNPVSAHARALTEEMGSDTPIDWVHRSARFGEKLHGFSFSTLERIGGTPCVLIGLMSVRRSSKRDQVLRGLMGEAYHRALMAFPDEREKLAADIHAKGGAMIESPVGGPTAPARDGKLIGFGYNAHIPLFVILPNKEGIQ